MAKSRVAGRGFTVFHEGRYQSFLPGERVPGDIVDRIKNPKIWEARGEVQEDTGAVSEEEASENSDEEMEEVGGGAGGDDPADELDDTLDSLTVKQLIELCDETGVDRTGLTKKAELVKAIKDHGAL